MLKLILAGVAAVVATAPVSAGLLGHTVEAKWFSIETFPGSANTAIRTYLRATTVAGGGVVIDHNPPFYQALPIDYSDNGIVIINDYGFSEFLNYSFNGFEFKFPDITLASATINPLSGFRPVSISLSAHMLTLNYAGVVLPNGFGASGIDLTFAPDVPGPTGAVPEPATWALLVAGFGAVGVMARRRRVVTVA